MSPNVWTMNTQGMVAKCQTFTQNVECLSPSSSPLVKDVSITCSPVWWSEVVPESCWCFVWSQTGHDHTVLPWSSWRANLLCGSQVKKQGERLSSMAGWTVRGGRRAGGVKPYSPWSESSMDCTRKIKALTYLPHAPTCLLHPMEIFQLLVSDSHHLLIIHTFRKTNTHIV